MQTTAGGPSLGLDVSGRNVKSRYLTKIGISYQSFGAKELWPRVRKSVQIPIPEFWKIDPERNPKLLKLWEGSHGIGI